MRSKKIVKWGILLVLPYLVYSTIFWGIPFGWSFILSFFKWSVISPTHSFVLLENFITLIYGSPIAVSLFVMLRNTLYFMAVFIPIVVFGSITFALLVSRIKRFKSIFIIGFLMSYFCPGVGYTLIFGEFFAEDGLFNNLLMNMGIHIPWLSDYRLAMVSVAIIVIWKCIGYYGLLFMAGLQAIPPAMHEAARIDGAGAWTRFWKITFPLLNAPLVITLTLSTGMSFALFTEIFMLTGGGPQKWSHTFMYEIYTQIWTYGNAGYGSAVALVTGFIGFGLILLIRKLVEREVYT